MQNPIVIEDFNPQWSVTFEQIRLELAAVLGTLALRIEHVGSTAVPGLPAKPIIDIDVVMDTESELPAVTDRLTRLGYTYQGDQGIPRRYAFRARDPEPAHHLYVCAKDSPELHRHLSFRDYLRTHPSTAQAYGALKRQIQSEVAGDRVAYTERKGAFIEAILQEAHERTKRGRQILDEFQPYATWSEKVLLNGVDEQKLKALLE